jgi:hypothetical protein
MSYRQHPANIRSDCSTDRAIELTVVADATLV